MRRAAPGTRRGSTALAALLLAACAAGPAPRDHFYRLEAGAPEQSRSAPALPGVLEVDLPRADSLLRQRALLRSESGGELTPYRYHLWSDSPVRLVQLELARYLRQAGLAGEVVTPDLGTQRPDWILRSHLHRLEQHTGQGASGVLVELELALAAADPPRLVLRQTYRAERSAATEPARAVTAFDAALAEIFARFAADAAASR
jgi:ABC-type uncharacterized transport system auxiliary subunit